MFSRLGHYAAHYYWQICLAWIGVGLSLAVVAPKWDAQAQDDDVRFVPERFTSVRAYQLLQKAFPQDVFASRVVFAVERNEATLSEDDFQFVAALVNDLEKLKQEVPELKIGKIESFQSGLIGWRLVSSDQQCTLIQMSLGTPYLAAATQQAVERADAVVKARFRRSAAEGLQVHTTGAAGIGRDLSKATGDSLHHTTWATIILVVVVLLAVYRAPLLALVPLITIAISVWVSLNLLALMTKIPGVHLVNISKVFAIVILYGAGTDYCLFLISRYREELEKGFGIEDAIERGVGGVGAALAASAGTVMVGLGLMAFAEFAKVRYAGPAIALSLGIALAASMTLTPALLSMLGRVAFWPGSAPRPDFRARLAKMMDTDSPGIWDRVSRWVVRNPALVWCASVAILAPFIVLGLSVQSSYRATGELSPNSPSLKGLAAIQHHFAAGEVGPVTILLTSKQDWNRPLGRREIERLSQGFARLDGVAEVRSLAQPVGLQSIEISPDPKGKGMVHRLLTLVAPLTKAWNDDLISAARSHYVAKVPLEPDSLLTLYPPKTSPTLRALKSAFVEPPAEAPDEYANVESVYVTKIDVILKTDPFEPASVETLKLLQVWLREDLPHFNLLDERLRSECYGVTAIGQDLAEVTESDRLRVNGFVLAAILLILLVLVRRLWLALYLLVTVLGSYYAALGATALMGIFWTGHTLTHVDWRVPFFLFTILVAVGEDYNILLISRALEERKKHGGVEGMRRALAKTGGAITSCGLIMAGTFATLMLAGLNTLTQIGFALAVGVLVDTFIVRPFLVPACVILLWQGAADPAAGEPAKKDDPLYMQVLKHAA